MQPSTWCLYKSTIRRGLDLFTVDSSALPESDGVESAILAVYSTSPYHGSLHLLFSSTFISDTVFGSRQHVGRNLLRAKKACPVNFEFLNYTIITGKCKGPQYPPKICCSAFKEFACPYADVLNDLSNDCASTMFSYINLYGKYPPGLFASVCREEKQGLKCPALPPPPSANDAGTANRILH